MIDRNLLSQEFEETARRYARRGVPREALAEAAGALQTRRELVHQVDEIRATLNQSSKDIGAAVREGRDVEAVKQRVAAEKQRLADLEARLQETDEKLDYALMRLPNLPQDEAPEGLSEDKNVIRRTWGYDPARFEGKTYLPHWDVATALGIFDSERAAKISGAMFALLRGQGARLLHALVQFGLEINRERYEEIAPPHFVRTETFTATGHLPKFEPEAYKMRDDDLWAIPTGEVPLMSLHRDEMIPVEELPRRYMAYTVCFRREAGSAGKDTRGMQRLHEFHKVELVKLCLREQVQAEYEGMLADAERALQLLELPYRVVDLCCGDLTFSSARVHDLEVYAPGVQRWLEVSSVGVFTDFQARRGNIRTRRPGGKPEFVHALNGSALATPRVWAAVIEHGQQPDGSVKLPAPLVKYMGTDTIARP